MVAWEIGRWAVRQEPKLIGNKDKDFLKNWNDYTKSYIRILDQSIEFLGFFKDPCKCYYFLIPYHRQRLMNYENKYNLNKLTNLLKYSNTITFGMLSHSSQLFCLRLFICVYFEIKGETIEIAKVS